MRKKVLVGTGIAAVFAVVFLLGSLGLVPAFAQAPPSTNGTQAIVQSADDDDATEAAVKGPDTDAVEEQVGNQTGLEEQAGNQTLLDEQQPQYSGSIQVDEADEAAALQSEATISAADAEAAALAANSDTSVIKTELDNENGALVYSVELSNGNDVKVDAGNGQILHTEAGDLDQETAED
jgi:uncharacterized membrane protein YkoI